MEQILRCLRPKKYRPSCLVTKKMTSDIKIPPKYPQNREVLHMPIGKFDNLRQVTTHLSGIVSDEGGLAMKVRGICMQVWFAGLRI